MAQLHGVEAGREVAGIPAATARPASLRKRFAAVGRHALLAGVAVVFTTPFYWMVTSALKDNGQIFARPIVWWPDPILWQTYSEALTYEGFPFLQFLKNSLLYSGSVTV